MPEAMVPRPEIAIQIENKPADDHRSWHQELGDFVRWGSTRLRDVN